MLKLASPKSVEFLFSATFVVIVVYQLALDSEYTRTQMCYILLKTIFLLLTTQIAMFASNKTENAFDESIIHSAIEIFLHINTKESIVFSPFSIQTCLALARVGAEGETANEITKGLRLISDDVYEMSESFGQALDILEKTKFIHIANKIYIKQGYKINSKFEGIASKQFHSNTEEIDFNQNIKSANDINNWISLMTNNKIKKIISPDILDEETRLILLNAIHFKGEWLNKFNNRETEEDNFYVIENKPIKVQMMKQKGKFYYGKVTGATILEMPYKDCDLSMVVILPDKNNDVLELKNTLKSIFLKDTISDMEETEVLVKIPKFKVEYTLDVEEILKMIGIKKMFGKDAEFGNMLDSPDELKVSKIIHKSFIDVNEDGVEVAATTGCVVRNKRSIDITEPKTFIANRPFVYLITTAKNKGLYERIILFVGATTLREEIPLQTSHDEF